MIIRKKVVSICVAIISLSWTTLQAAEFYVNSYRDAVDNDLNDGVCLTATGVCSLRAAVMQANYSPDHDIITIRTGWHDLRFPRTIDGGWDGELNDTMGDLDIFHDVTIRGESADPTHTVLYARRWLEDRVFHIKGSSDRDEQLNVVIENITIFDGEQRNEPNGGGGILVVSDRSGLGQPPQLLLRNSILRRNMSPYSGAGLANWGGDVVIEDSIFEENWTSYVPNYTDGWQGSDRPSELDGGGMGGAIGHWAGSMTIRRSILDDNKAQAGGGIYVQDTFPAAILLVEDSEIRNNLSFMGAGIASFAGIASSDYGVTVVRSTLSGNEAEFAGGGIYNIGTMLISNSTLSGNRAWDLEIPVKLPTKGGGIYNAGRVLDIVSSTIAGNEARDLREEGTNTDLLEGGDEIFFDYVNSTVDRRSTLFSSRFSIRNSIIGDGVSPTDPLDPASSISVDDDCHGPDGYQALIVSFGGNTEAGSTCFIPTVTTTARSLSKSLAKSLSDTSGQGAGGLGLAPLADNGGAVFLPDGSSIKTRALSPTSSALGRGTGCPGGDQRNFARVGNCDSGAFQVSVDETAPGNSAPVTFNDEVSIEVGDTIDIPVLVNDHDPDVTDDLTIVAITGAPVGTVSIEDNFVHYVAPANEAEAGTLPRAINMVYTVSDGESEVQGDVLVWIYAADSNTPPTGVEDEFVVGEGQSVYLDVLNNDSDDDAGDDAHLAIYAEENESSSTTDTSTSTTTDGNNTNTTTNTNTRTHTISNNSVDIATPGGNVRLLNGNTIFLYTPNEGFTGVDEFTYDLVDPRGGKTEGIVVRVTVNKTPVFDEASLVDLVVEAGQSVTGNVVATDDESDDLRFLSVDGAKGHVEMNGDGSFIYIADPHTSGDDEFTVIVTDGMSTRSATVHVTIAPGSNTAPTGVEDIHDVLVDQVYDLDVVANDFDPDTADQGQLVIAGDLDVLSTIGGTVVKLSDTTVRFTPDAGFIGTYEFTYIIEDAEGAQSAPTLVTFEVRENLEPEFYQETYQVYVEAGESYAGQVKAKDADGEPLTYMISPSELGSISYDDETGQFTYSAGNELGSEEVRVVARDAFGDAEATIMVNVLAKTSSSSLSSNSGGGGSGGSSDGGGGALNVYVMALILGLLSLVRLGRRS